MYHRPPTVGMELDMGITVLTAAELAALSPAARLAYKEARSLERNADRLATVEAEKAQMPTAFEIVCIDAALLAKEREAAANYRTYSPTVDAKQNHETGEIERYQRTVKPVAEASYFGLKAEDRQAEQFTAYLHDEDAVEGERLSTRGRMRMMEANKALVGVSEAVREAAVETLFGVKTAVMAEVAGRVAPKMAAKMALVGGRITVEASKYSGSPRMSDDQWELYRERMAEAAVKMHGLTWAQAHGAVKLVQAIEDLGKGGRLQTYGATKPIRPIENRKR